MPATAVQAAPELSAVESDYSVPESTTDLEPAVQAEGEEPRPRTRRAPARSRARRPGGDEGQPEQPSGEAEAATASEEPAQTASRRPRSRGGSSRTTRPTPAAVELSVADDAPAEEEALADALPAPIELNPEPAIALGSGATVDLAADTTVEVEESASAGQGEPSDWLTSEVAGNVREPTRYRRPSMQEGRGPAAQSADFEPMPPPTKRKAPRVGFGIVRPPQPGLENAVDWALGRPAPIADDAPSTNGDVELVPSRRRRSRRGRRGHGGATETAAADIESPVASVAAPPLEERSAPIPQRDRTSYAPPPPQRDDRTRSQLSTFESLVARQNVVLDALLAKVSSFANIERALNMIERRLSGATAGAAGVATPRVGIFVDVPNIIYAAERIGATIDFGRLLHLLSRGRELVRASAYAPISDDPQQRLDTQRFVQPFMHRGYRIMTKPLKRFSDGTMKGNFDVELAMDVLTMSDRLDIVSLVSGDGDFSRLVEIVGSKGVRVEVVAFGTSTSAELRTICDDYLDISEHLHELT